jgi:vacuolar-type H+-ATPase subunit E/Vma4
MIDRLRRRYEQLQGLIDTSANQQGGLLGNIPQAALLGSAIYGQGLQGKDPLQAFFPAAMQTAQLQRLMTPKKANKFRALTSAEFEKLKSEGVNLDPNKGYQINERTNEIKQIGSGQTINIGDTQKVASAGTPKDKQFLGLNPNDDVIVFKKNNQIVDFKVNSFADNRLKDIAKAVKESKLSDVDSALKDIEDYIEGLDGKNLPGVGLVQGNIPGFATSEAGNELRALISKYSNITLKERSGAAVTPNEFERFQKELVGALTTPDEKTFLKILKNNRQALEKQKRQVFAAYRDEDLDSYFKSGGLSFYEGTQQQTPSSGLTLTPEQLQALPTNILEELLKNLPR